MTNTDYDLIVLGGGMAGLPVAMKCGYSGMDVALVEEGLLGGTCLNRGCIPTKTMLRSAEVANLARRSEEFGIDIDGAIEPDIDAIVERKDDIVESIRKGAYENVESNENIDFVEGHGIFESPHEIRVDDQTLSAETIVINTGARPTRPSIDGLDDVDVHDSTDLLERASIPPHWPSSAVATSAVSTPRCTAGSGRTSPSSSAATPSSQMKIRT